MAAAVERIAAGDFDKVVLARRIDIAANRPFVKSDVLARLIALYPSCMVFSVDGFIGASPELLIARTGTRWSATRWPARWPAAATPTPTRPSSPG